MRKVLIVDDSATMRRMVISSLRELGDIRFDEAASGLEAIERMAIGRVDLIVLDLNMPDMHGMEVLKFVRKQPKFSAIPIVVLTTRSDDSSQSECLSNGASVYMTKPFDPRTLATTVRGLLDKV